MSHQDQKFERGSSVNNDEEQQALEDIDILLARSAPRNLWEGIGSGIGFIVAGAVGACGILVLSPHVGAIEGAKGYGTTGLVIGGLVGATVGVGSAISVAAGGLLSGVGQIVRGIANHPSQYIEPRRGKWWSVNEGKWVKTHLKSEKEWIEQVPEYDEDLIGEAALPEDILEARLKADDKYQRAIEFGVHDTEFYDLLGVDPDASVEDINRRFAQLAKVFNPNRAGGDTPASREKFDEINTAYVILSNEVLRKRYDKDGIDGVLEGSACDKPLLNPIQVFTTLYGTENCVPYIGRLAAVTEAAASAESASKMTLAVGRQLQRRRVTRLALLLADRLKLWVKGDRDAAKAEWEEQARVLCDSSYGVDLVHAIGAAYSLSAAQFLGSFESGVGMPSISRWAHKQRITIQQLKRTTSKPVEFGVDAKKIKLKQEAIEQSEKDVTDDELFERMGKDVMEMLWTRTAVDVASTIHEASQMVLFDMDLNDDTRKMRGEGLEVLGQIFQDATFDKSEDALKTQSEYERIAFYSLLEVVRNQEISTRNASVNYE